MKTQEYLIITLTLLSLLGLGLTIQKSNLSVFSNTIEEELCQPYGAHIELGTSYQQNVYVNRDEEKFQKSNQFVVAYQTKGNTCIYGQDIEIEMNPGVTLQRVSNYTSAPDHSTINCAKYGISNSEELTYAFNSALEKTNKIILPDLIEDKGKSYQICLFNQVEDLSQATCNLAQLFHYTLDHPYNFFVTEKFNNFISSHVIHPISSFSTFDADLAPFGSKQYYFNLNFMFMMTLDITEPENIHLIQNIFEKNVPIAQQNRQERPWFVGMANNSPYILNNEGVTLDCQYNQLYENINSANFDIVFTSSANSSNLNIYQGFNNNTQFLKLQNSQNNIISSNNGVIIVEIPTFVQTPIVFETSINNFKVIQNGKIVLQVNKQ